MKKIVYMLMSLLGVVVFNLQLFANEVQTTLMDGLSPEMKTFYDMTLIDEAQANLVHDQFGQKRPIPKGGGKTIEFRKFAPLAKATTPLTEGVTPDGKSLTVTAITATVAQYGDYITQSDVLELTALDNTILEATKLLGRQAGVTLDTVVRNVLQSGTNVTYCPKVAGDGTETEVTSRSALDNTCQLTVKVVQQVVAKLRAQNAPTIGGKYVAIIHPYANETSSEINWMIDKWNYQRETGSDEGYSKYLKFYKAVETGEDLEGVIQMYTENDVERSTLSRQLTEHFKPEYVEMDEAKRDDIRGNLLKAMEELGSTQEEAEDRIAEWDFEANYGFTYEDREKAYMAGTISSAQMRQAYLDRGKTEEEADLLVEAHEWLKRNHREDLYASKVIHYIKNIKDKNTKEDLGYSIEDTGMDIDLYFEAYSYVEKIEGNEEAYSRIDQAFPYINSLDLTPEQKTALAVACGWGLKTVNKNKLW